MSLKKTYRVAGSGPYDLTEVRADLSTGQVQELTYKNISKVQLEAALKDKISTQYQDLGVLTARLELINDEIADLVSVASAAGYDYETAQETALSSSIVGEYKLKVGSNTVAVTITESGEIMNAAAKVLATVKMRGRFSGVLQLPGAGGTGRINSEDGKYWTAEVAENKYILKRV